MDPAEGMVLREVEDAGRIPHRHCTENKGQQGEISPAALLTIRKQNISTFLHGNTVDTMLYYLAAEITVKFKWWHMKLSEIVRLIDGVVLTGEDKLDEDFTSAYSADLLSDVLALTKGHTLLITGTVSLQVIRVSEILGITAVIFIRGKMPSNEVLETAKKKLKIPLIFTKKTMFETSGILYEHNVRPCANMPADEV